MARYRLLLLFAATVSCTACETLGVVMGDEAPRIEKDANGLELQKETVPVTALPTGCPTITVPSGPSGVTVSYKEPTTNADGTRLADLKSTVIYVSADGRPEKRIQVWTNNWSGGADVTIHHVTGSSPTIGLCVIALDLAENASAPATPAPSRP